MNNYIVLFRTEIVSCVNNMLHISARPAPLYAPSSLSLGEPNVIFLALLLLKLASWAMLFIFQLMDTLLAMIIRYRVNNIAK